MHPILGFRDNKQCPQCEYILTQHTPQCWACGFQFSAVSSALGALSGRGRGGAEAMSGLEADPGPNASDRT